MSNDEIKVPRELRQFMLERAEETAIGQKNGANRQYRYGNLHIREYDDEFLLHMDVVDPRKNPLGHLMADAPEVLIGLTCAALGGAVGAKTAAILKKDKTTLVLSGLLSSVAAGCIGYAATKKLKELAR